MTIKTEDEIVARKRITQIFRYLEELNRRRNPVVKIIDDQPWKLRLADLPIHPAVQLGRPLPNANDLPSSNEDFAASPDEENFVLRVGRSQTTTAPEPPAELRAWLRPGWDDPYKEVDVFPSRNREVDGETVVIPFEEDAKTQCLFFAWKQQRDAWAINEKPARAARKLFEDLYAVYGQMERESERQELVLGDGILNWRRPEGIVRHPILLQRLQLRFDPQKPEFVLQRADYPVELYSALFRGMAEIEGAVIGKCRIELDEAQFDPLDDDLTTGFLRRLVAQLSPRGELVDASVLRGPNDDPQIVRDAVIYMRRRTLGYAAALEAILTDLRDQNELPASLLGIVGIDSSLPEQLPEKHENLPHFTNTDERILLSKPANQEQVEIAQRLDAHGCVLVQGPPGTGKTHTIANLIGHLLAQGKSILVTSHTTKALRVLREQVVPQLQPLCVSVLEGNEESRQQLEYSVSSIVERLGSTNAETLDRQARQLTEARHVLQKDHERLMEELQRARFDEYRDIVVAGQSFSPSEAGRRVATGRDKNSWIPATVTPDSPLPLTAMEFIALYRTNVTLSPQDETDISSPLPKMEDLITPAEFLNLRAEGQRLEKTDRTLLKELWQPVKQEPSPEALSTLLQKAVQAVTLMNHGTDWQSAAIEAGRDGGPQRKLWNSLLTLIQETEQEAAAVQEIQMRHGPALAQGVSLEDQTRLLAEIINHLENAKRLSWVIFLQHGDWKKLIAELRVGSQSPTTLEHFQVLQATAKLEVRRKQLKEWWERQMLPLGGADINSSGLPPEQACRQYKSSILEALDWHQTTWLPIEQEFQQVGFNWPGLLQKIAFNFAPRGELLRLRDAVLQHLKPVFQSRVNYRKARNVIAKIQDVVRSLDMINEKGASPVVLHLREALLQWNTAAYQSAYERLVELNRKASELTLRREFLSRLETSAPAWAAAIRDRQAPHHQRDLPGDPDEGWLWRQLNDEIDRRNQTSLDSIQQSITQTSTQFQQSTAELVDRLAWAAQVRRTSIHQRQSLKGYVQTIKKMGKGTGKKVPKLQAEARRLMADAQSAVPVWIMPLSRVVESFNPTTTRFDVVIIDEASQLDVMGLIALYMCKQIVVVGDDQQVSPDAIGEKVDDVQHLQDEHLTNIPNAHLYDGQQSIYDLADRSFGGTICLREHFRCVSDIIQFSNRLSYQGKIRPLRDASSLMTKPFVVEYRVEGAVSSTKVNEKEALTTASLIAAAIEQPEYANHTFGVISLVGEEQARRIETLLRSYLPPVEYEQRRIMCGTPPQFQGDERDVIFLSIVDGPQDGPLSLRQQPLFKKRFNVAASRARNQMWVVHSLNPEIDLKPGDLRRDLIEYARNPQAFGENLRDKEEQTDSDFERQVLRRLMYAGYRVSPQWKVGYYRIDMVVEGSGKRLAVECDGDRFHTMDNLAADMQRQAILERLGWTFVRIRVSEFYRNPDKAMMPLFDRLVQMEITPASTVSEDFRREIVSASGNVRDRVVLRAALLRREWEETECEDIEQTTTTSNGATSVVRQSSFVFRDSDKINT